MTIYIDVIFIENMIMNYIILLATGIALKNKINHVRLLISSMIGTIYTVCTYIMTITLSSNFFLKILLSIIMIYIAFNPQNMKKMWKQLLFFYLISFVFGGAAFALIYFIKPQEILMKNGLFLGTYPLKSVMIATVLAFSITIIVFRIIKNKISKKDIHKQIIIHMKNQQIKVNSMIDSGNMLKEPITGKSVIVIEHSCLYGIIPKEILNNIEKILGGDIDGFTEQIKKDYITKLKFIPFSSLGKQNGMLLGIAPEYIEIIDENNVKRIDGIILGIYNKSFTKDGSYRALMGIDLI